MIDLAAVRTYLGQALACPARIPDDDKWTVVERAVDGVLDPPLVLIGLPAVDLDKEPCGVDQITLGIAVMVRRHAVGDTATVAQLERIWPAVMDQLRTVCRNDQTLGGLVVNASVTGADPDVSGTQGQELPVYIISLEILG